MLRVKKNETYFEGWNTKLHILTLYISPSLHCCFLDILTINENNVGLQRDCRVKGGGVSWNNGGRKWVLVEIGPADMARAAHLHVKKSVFS